MHITGTIHIYALNNVSIFYDITTRIILYVCRIILIHTHSLFVIFSWLSTKYNVTITAETSEKSFGHLAFTWRLHIVHHSLCALHSLTVHKRLSNSVQRVRVRPPFAQSELTVCPACALTVHPQFKLENKTFQWLFIGDLWWICRNKNH